MGEGKNLLGVCLSVIVSLCYCYYISSRIPKGKLRFISLIPIFYLFAILPLFLSSALTTIITTCFITLLANSKLILFCFGKGPLSSGPQKSLLIFITISALPIKIDQDQNQNQNQKQPRTKKIPLNLTTEALLLAIMAATLHSGRESFFNIHPNLVLVLYCCIAYLFVDVVVASSSVIVRAVTGFELEPPSDEPYVSTSLQDFWGKRWDLIVTNTLRHIVYLPVRSALVGLLGKDKASLVGVFASFFVSGLIHELVFYYPTRVTPTWEAAAFFWIHGVCVVVELVAKRALADRWPLPPYVSAPLTVAFVVVTSCWLFFPPIVSSGLEVKINGELMYILEYMNSKLQVMYSLASQRAHVYLGVYE